jgi:hypothetical protein
MRQPSPLPALHRRSPDPRAVRSTLGTAHSITDTRRSRIDQNAPRGRRHSRRDRGAPADEAEGYAADGKNNCKQAHVTRSDAAW